MWSRGSITAYVGDQTIEVDAGSYAARPKRIPHGLTVRGESAHPLIGLQPTGAAYFLVSRDESDSDAARFGLEIEGELPAS
jgi:hypothetical protein